MDSPPLPIQFARWLEEGDDGSLWGSGPGLNLSNARLQTSQPPSPKIEYELIKFEFSESEQNVKVEILKRTTTQDHTVSDLDEQGVEMEERGGELVADEESQQVATEGVTEGDIESGASQMFDVGTEGQAESTLEIPLDDTDTEVQSVFSDHRPEMPDVDGSGNDTESTRLDAKTRWAFLDESQREEGDMREAVHSESLDLPDQSGLAFTLMQKPEVPPSIMEQVSIIASQRPNSLSDQEYQDFLREPLEEQRRSLRIFLDFLESQGPWYGVKRRLSQEKLCWNFENDQ